MITLVYRTVPPSRSVGTFLLLQSERRQRRCFLFPLHCLTSKREAAMFLLLCQFCQNSTQATLISTPSRLSQVMHLHRVQYTEADPTCALTAAASICARAPGVPRGACMTWPQHTRPTERLAGASTRQNDTHRRCALRSCCLSTRVSFFC
jgi:hypothetical protein